MAACGVPQPAQPASKFAVFMAYFQKHPQSGLQALLSGNSSLGTDSSSAHNDDIRTNLNPRPCANFFSNPILARQHRVRFKLMCEMAQADHFESLAWHG
jgi:hypothetical protein